ARTSATASRLNSSEYLCMDTSSPQPHGLVQSVRSEGGSSEVKQGLAAWLAPRGLSFNEDKTKIVHVEEGFSFLGYSIRRYVAAQGSGKLLIKPSQESVERFRKRLAAEVHSLRGANAAAVVARLNPV